MHRKPEPFYWLNDPKWYCKTEDGYEMTEEAPKEAVKKWKKAWEIKDKKKKGGRVISRRFTGS